MVDLETGPIWPVREENLIRSPERGVLLRRYPYPFRAAVSISNDIDRMKVDAFDDFHDFVCGDGQTPYGPGLGLEVSNSFWIWSAGGAFSLYHSDPFDKQAPLSPEAGRLIELAKGGVIDALHNFGQWRTGQPMLREDSSRALEILDRFDIHPKIWINHGGNQQMQHQIEGRWAYQWFGDVIDHQSYCHDLLQKAGFLFFSNGMFAESERFGEHCVYSSQEEMQRDFENYRTGQFFRRYNPLEDTYFEPYDGISDAHALSEKRKLFNKILVPDVANDGNAILYFKRFRGLDRPTAANFNVQINHYSLAELVRKKASVIVFQHFGVWRASMSPHDHRSDRRSVPPVLDIHNQAAFEALAAYNANGDVWVPALARFLQFSWIRDYLQFDVEQLPDKTIINISHVDCPVQGVVDLDICDLNGLAFLVKKECQGVEVFLKDRNVTDMFKRDRDTVLTNQDCVYSKYEKRFEYIPS